MKGNKTENVYFS